MVMSLPHCVGGYSSEIYVDIILLYIYNGDRTGYVTNFTISLCTGFVLFSGITNDDLNGENGDSISFNIWDLVWNTIG